MNELFEEFAAAHTSRNGYAIAQTLSPVPPPHQPHKLASIWQSTNSHSVKGDTKHFIKHNMSYRGSLDQDEVNGWVEVYTAYWKAIGEILSGETGKVSLTPPELFVVQLAKLRCSHHGPRYTRLGKNSLRRSSVDTTTTVLKLGRYQASTLLANISDSLPSSRMRSVIVVQWLLLLVHHSFRMISMRTQSVKVNFAIANST
jgi:hypothetical protein